MIYIFWTCGNLEEAKRIARALIDEHLVACASLLPQITSIYRWQGKIEESNEVKVIFKTQSEHFDAICAYIQAHGSYEVPEILEVAIPRGNQRYISWVIEETKV